MSSVQNNIVIYYYYVNANSHNMTTPVSSPTLLPGMYLEASFNNIPVDDTLHPYQNCAVFDLVETVIFNLRVGSNLHRTL